MPTATLRPPRGPRSVRARAAARRAALSRPEVYDFVIRRREHYGNSQAPIPGRLVLLRQNPQDPSGDHLFLDQVPLPRDAWRYDPHDRVLSWRGAFGGGHLYLTHDGLSANGNIGAATNPVGVLAAATAVFSCDVALDTGASYTSSGGSVVGFTWDPSSAAWKGAHWYVDRLQLSYTVTPGGPMSPPTFTFDFQDNQTQSIPWDPIEGAFAASLQLGEQAGRMVWNLSFKSVVRPDPDKGLHPSTGPDTVYPYWLKAVEDAGAGTINGVMEIDAMAPHGTLVGIQGVRATAAATGYFRTAADAAPFGVFDGKLHLGGQPVAGSRLRGDTLSWSGLDPEHQARTGLPASGTLRFRADGSGAAGAAEGEAPVQAHRLSPSAAVQALSDHVDLHPQAAQGLRLALADTSLDMYGLLAMTPYVQNTSGAWYDAVQAAVTQDLGDIMNSFVPADLWKLLFPNTGQPTLTGELSKVANSPVAGVTEPTSFYSSLATAVFTQGLANGSDTNCRYLNGPRAAAWLKTQVASSKVYYTHGQELFQYEWKQRFPLTCTYQKDQVTNAAKHQTAIATQVQASVDDINKNVAADSTDPDLKTKLVAQVREVGQYATDNNLYWAFAYFTYNTAPAILSNIALQMGTATGSSDGTTLSRLFQQNVAVLTALDPSGYFARQYTSTLNIFLATNVLPSMFGFTGKAQSFDIIKQYLQQFVKNNINNEDQQIAAAAAQIQAILNDKEADAMLRASLEALNSFAGAIDETLALPYVANEFVGWFATEYPKWNTAASIFGSVFMGGIAGLAIMNLIRSFQDWDALSAEQKVQVITDATQLGLQIVAAVVKRAVRVYAIYGVDGMTTWQRVAAVNKIVITGEADQLDQGLVRIGNAAARWLGDTEGTVGRLAATNSGAVPAALTNGTASSAEEASFVGKVLGRNLDEFIATRIGPVFILAGIGFSIYQIAEGDAGVALTADLLNLVSGSLMLFAMAGEWAIAAAGEGMLAYFLAPAVAVAGPLAIVAALAGIGLMLYQMFQQPPNPVATFVSDYAAKHGFSVRSKGSSLDYAVPFANPDKSNLLMIGFTLSTGGQELACQADGSIRLGKPSTTPLPDTVWQATTDGLGMSQIITIAQPDAAKPPVPLLLSLMSDDTVSFQPRMSASAPSSGSSTGSAAAAGAPTVRTQTWLSAPTSDATLTSDGKFMVSLDLTLQPVLPDSSGNYAPTQASGWLVQAGGGVGYATSGPATFTLAMSGMAPNYMAMSDIGFVLNSTPGSQQSFGPRFGVLPSTPMTYGVTGALPAFLSFSTQTGTLSPNGQNDDTAGTWPSTITASNSLGKAQAAFTVKVAAPPSAPATAAVAAAPAMAGV